MRKKKIKEEKGLWVTERFVDFKGLFWIRWSVDDGLLI